MGGGSTRVFKGLSYEIMQKEIAISCSIGEFSVADKRHFELILTYRLPICIFVATNARRALRRHTYAADIGREREQDREESGNRISWNHIYQCAGGDRARC